MAHSSNRLLEVEKSKLGDWMAWGSTGSVEVGVERILTEQINQ